MVLKPIPKGRICFWCEKTGSNDNRLARCTVDGKKAYVHSPCVREIMGMRIEK